MNTCLIQTPHYYGQFSLSLGKENSYMFSKLNPLNTDTFCGPLSFCINRVLLYCIMDTSLTQTPHYCGQFSLSWENKILAFSKNSAHLILTPHNMDTFYGPLSICINKAWLNMIWEMSLFTEHCKNLLIDTWRLNQLDKSSVDPSHPYRKFGSGRPD